MKKKRRASRTSPVEDAMHKKASVRAKRGRVVDHVAALFKIGAPSIRRLKADPLKAGYYCGMYDMIGALDVLASKPAKLGYEFLEDMKDDCEKFFSKHRDPKMAKMKNKR